MPPTTDDGASVETRTATDGGEDHRVFWADEVADRVEARDPDGPVVVKGGVSPSGIPHLGHANELLRGYFVAEVLRERGHEVRQVFTTDDRDPLRKAPRRLATLDWELVDLSEIEAVRLQEHLGKPYTDVPDPFECCESYGDHFTKLLVDVAERLAVPVDVLSNTELYEEGAFEDVTRLLLEQREAARDLLADYQNTVGEDYVPFRPQCANCGLITEGVTAIDAESGTVEYRCTDVEAGNQTIAGCGHEGTATLREGKLPWRFEWPAQWRVLGVDFEPFGKDHAAGSWPSGVEIARELLDFEPPVDMVYEWFTVGGEPLSSSSGTVLTVPELLELVGLDVVRYFFAKDPRKARDLDVERVDQLVDEFDRFERIYFGEEPAADDRERALAERVYPFLVDEVREERIRLPYTFAAVLGMTDEPDLRERIARREGHVPEDAPGWAVTAAMERVERARAWARRMDNEYNYAVQRDVMPDVDFDAATGAALDDLADFVAAGHDGEAIQGEIYETAKRHDLDVGEFFGAGYRLVLDRDRGPKLGPLLAALPREFVVRRLRREG